MARSEIASPATAAAPARPGAAPAKALFAERARWRWPEIAYWLATLACTVLFPTHLMLIAQVLITGLFAVSFDLLVGYAGIASLGQAAFFGVGAYTAGLIAHNGWSEPLTGLLAGALAAGVLGFVFSILVSRLTGIALLMITFGVGLLVYEAAHSAHWLTGGDDGLTVGNLNPVLGIFPFDFLGRTAAGYAFVVVFLAYLLARLIVNSPFGLELKGIRENVRRVPAIGVPLAYRYMVAFTVSAILAGLAGALLAQITGTVALGFLSFDRSSSVLIMVILGGIGTLFGPLIGAALYMVAQDRLADLNPVYWNFYIGLMLVVVVLFARGGIVGGIERIERFVRGRWTRR
jgi:branched-chain amino acid transport system permease protein